MYNKLATRSQQELSSDRIQEVGQFLPGKIQQFWLSI